MKKEKKIQSEGGAAQPRKDAWKSPEAPSKITGNKIKAGTTSGGAEGAATGGGGTYKAGS